MVRAIFLSVALLIFNYSSVAFAQTAEKINAQILPTIWYSSLSVKEGDKIKVYAGIQNNSGVNFSGTVTFYADSAKIAQAPFNSASDSLKEVSAEWLASKGRHLFQAKLDADLPAGKELLSYESEESFVDVSHTLTIEEVKEDAIETLVTVKEKIDEAAETFAEKLESMKKPESEDISIKSLASQFVPSKFLSSESDNSTDNSKIDSDSLLASVFNSGIDLAGILIRNWHWTLAGLAALYLFFKFS